MALVDQLIDRYEVTITVAILVNQYRTVVSRAGKRYRRTLSEHDPSQAESSGEDDWSTAHARL